MKKKIVTVFMLLAFNPFNVFADDIKPYKSEFIFEIKYNSIDLKKAAEVEEKLIEEFGDACTISYKVNKTSGRLFPASVLRLMEQQ